MQNLKKKFLDIEAAGGAALLCAAILGFLLCNSVFRVYYDNIIKFPVVVDVGFKIYTKPLLFLINDGLVSIFFFLIGLEIRSMLTQENLSIEKQLALPGAAAIAGAVFPALIYVAFNYHDQVNMRGWAIPTAMDTAFILGVLALFKKKISNQLKIFVMSLSIMDDILAVLVIAMFYAGEISSLAVVLSASILAILFLMNKAGFKKPSVYWCFGFLLWVSVLGSGVHTSIAGILLATTIPHVLIEPMKSKLHPWVAFGILPVFAFANTGIPVTQIALELLYSPLALGIILGLFIGKQLGVFSIIYYLVKYSSYKLPVHTNWIQMYGVSVLCGIGFTMSLFIGVLAFESGGPSYDNIVKSSVLIGSLLSAMFGIIILRLNNKPS